LRKGADLIVCNCVYSSITLELLEPFKLQWVTIVEKSGAFSLAVDWFNYFNCLGECACWS